MTRKEKGKETGKVIESVILSEEEILTAPQGCKGFVAEIGPEEAQNIIEHMKNFRDPLPTRVKMYATDMKTGKWKLNEADSIVIWRYPNTGGWDVRNGNHRMHAIVKSGTRQLFMVVVTDHEPHDELYDGGTIRTLPQFFKNQTGIADRRAASLALELIKQQHVHRSVVSKDMALEAYRQYKDGIDYVIQTAAPKQKMGLTVPLFLAMVRGFYNTTNPDRLREFAEAIEGQQYAGPKDDGARLLNIQRAAGKTGSAAAYYLKCERAVYMFINNKPGSSSKSGFTPASYPGHLLPIAPYSGAGAAPAVAKIVPVMPPSHTKKYTEKAPYRIRQILMANEGVAYTTSELSKLYKKLFNEDLSVTRLAQIMSQLYTEAGFSEPKIKNKKHNARAIRYYVAK